MPDLALGANHAKLHTSKKRKAGEMITGICSIVMLLVFCFCVLVITAKTVEVLEYLKEKKP